MVTILATTSQEAAPDVPEGFCFLVVDGSHRYEDVKRDIEDYLPKLKPGGIVFFDDYGPYHAPGVRRAVNEFIAGNPWWRIVQHNSNSIILQKSIKEVLESGNL
jgi:hypothetical protein